VDTYARLPEHSWSAGDKRSMEPMTPHGIGKILNNDEASLPKALAEDLQLPSDDVKKTKGAGSVPIFHD
jgi:hypothetical protein